MNNHCSPDSLSAYLDHMLSANEISALQDHLAECATCDRELQALRSAKNFLAAAPVRTMPPSLQEALRRRAPAPALLPRILGWLQRPQVWIPAGAMAALALALFLNVSDFNGEETLPLEPLLAAHSRYTAEGLASQTNLATSNFSRQLARYENNEE